MSFAALTGERETQVARIASIRQDALRFLDERIERKVKVANRPHCKPPFDG
jgi:hypothetical protein